MAMRCPSCGSVVGVGAQKCQQCGQSMEIGALIVAANPKLAGWITVIFFGGLIVLYFSWCR